MPSAIMLRLFAAALDIDNLPITLSGFLSSLRVKINNLVLDFLIC